VSDRGDRLKQARTEAAAVLGLPETDLHVRRYALLACKHDDMTARYVADESLDVSELIEIEAAMREIRETLPQPPVRVELKLFGGDGETVLLESKPGERFKDTMRRWGEWRDQSPAVDTPRQAILKPAHASEAVEAVATPPKAPKPVSVAEPRPFHEVMAKDTRPDAPINGGGSLVWHTGARNGGSAW